MAVIMDNPRLIVSKPKASYCDHCESATRLPMIWTIGGRGYEKQIIVRKNTLSTTIVLFISLSRKLEWVLEGMTVMVGTTCRLSERKALSLALLLDWPATFNACLLLLQLGSLFLQLVLHLSVPCKELLLALL